MLEQTPPAPSFRDRRTSRILRDQWSRYAVAWRSSTLNSARSAPTPSTRMAVYAWWASPYRPATTRALHHRGIGASGEGAGPFPTRRHIPSSRLRRGCTLTVRTIWGRDAGPLRPKRATWERRLSLGRSPRDREAAALRPRLDQAAPGTPRGRSSVGGPGYDGRWAAQPGGSLGRSDRMIKAPISVPSRVVSHASV
jgi:hypothetical protein